MAAIVVKDLPTCLSSVPEIRLSKQWRCFLSRIYICTDFAVGGKFFFCGEVFLVARFFFFFFYLWTQDTFSDLHDTSPKFGLFISTSVLLFIFFSLFLNTRTTWFFMLKTALKIKLLLYFAETLLCQYWGEYRTISPYSFHSFLCE